MKKIVKLTIFVVVVIILVYLIKDNYYTIINKIEYIYSKYIQTNIKQTLTDNKYRKKEEYKYLKIDENTTIKNKDQIKDVLYTFLDAGWNEYMVVCDPDYTTCIDDVKTTVQDKSYLTDISNYVHPYNTFEKINTTFTSTGKIKFVKQNRYTTNQIKQLNEKVDQIYNELYDPKKNVKENIKIFHDYIINNTKYDKENDLKTASIPSSNAYGVLFDGVGICSGYTDAMQLFLEKLNVKTYRISSNTHIWNLVYVEGKWLHLDLTWDDPLMSDGTDALHDDYFLINTKKLKEKNDDEHNFDENIFIEAK